MRAMQHYSDLADIRRVMGNTHAIQPEALKEFFGDRLSSEWALTCLGDLVQNPQNLNLVVDIAVEYTDAMGGWEEVLKVLEAAPNGAQAEFAYLARRIPTSTDTEEHYRCDLCLVSCLCEQWRWLEAVSICGAVCCDCDMSRSICCAQSSGAKQRTLVSLPNTSAPQRTRRSTVSALIA
jgi:hypothetical protein